MSAGASDLDTVLDRWRLGNPAQSWPAGWGTNNRVHVVDVPGRRVVVRVYQNLDATQVAAEHAVLAALAAAHLPFQVPRPLTTPDGSTWVVTPDGPAAVFDWLDGERPDPTPHALDRVGRALGALDVALAGLDPGLGVHDWRRGVAATHPAVTDLTGLVDEFDLDGDLADIPALDETYLWLLDRGPVQLVHQDPALSNFLVRDGEVTSALDFELVGVDTRVSDVVAALVNTGCLEPARDPLARATALLRGYGACVRLTPEELTALPALLRFRSAGGVVWRYGRYVRGLTGREDVRIHLRDLASTTAWVREHGDALVEKAAAHCG